MSCAASLSLAGALRATEAAFGLLCGMLAAACWRHAGGMLAAPLAPLEAALGADHTL